MSYLMTHGIYSYLGVGLETRSFLFICAVVPLLRTATSTKIPLYTVTEPFTWKSLHLDINTEELPVSGHV